MDVSKKLCRMSSAHRRCCTAATATSISFVTSASFLKAAPLEFHIFIYVVPVGLCNFTTWSPRVDGVMDSVLASGDGEPGSIPALSKWFFSLGYKVVGKNGTRHDKICVA